MNEHESDELHSCDRLTLVVCIRPWQPNWPVPRSMSNASATVCLESGMGLQRMRSDSKLIPHRIRPIENGCMQLHANERDEILLWSLISNISVKSIQFADISTRCWLLIVIENENNENKMFDFRKHNICLKSVKHQCFRSLYAIFIQQHFKN